MSTTLTLLPGDGIGPEVTAATVRVLEAVGTDFTWESHVVGAEAVQQGDDPLPARVVDSIKHNKVCLKGPVTTPVGKGFRSINVLLRQELRTLRQSTSGKARFRASIAKFKDVDLVIVRENTEGLYSGIEHQVIPTTWSRASRSSPKRLRRRIARSWPLSYATRPTAASGSRRRSTRPTS